jgi:hypothetical protein
MVCWALSLALFCGACGGGKGKGADESPAYGDGTAWRDEEKPAGDGMVVEGIHGTIADRDANAAMETRYIALQKCFIRRYKQNEYLAGTMRLAFVVRVDGTVKTVEPVASDVGDRDTEKCVLEVGRKTRFPAPQGGEAEFTWSFTIDPLDGAHTADVLTDVLAADAVTEQRPSLDACDPVSGMVVTAYVDGAGAVVTAGSSAPANTAPEVLDCVALQLRSWVFPALGPPMRKFTLTVQ